MEDEEYKKLPIEDRCVHKLWKARVNGYEEVTKLFKQIDDEKSPEFAKYLGLVRKFVIDSNAMGQEKGLEATLAYVENYVNAGRTVSEVMSGIVSKCMAAPKTKTRELALQVAMMYVEIEKQDAVIEELIKGMDQKNPKIVAACVAACTSAVREFGLKIINPKLLVKKLPTLFADRDKSVRDEARQLTIEMYRWMGASLRSQLTSLQAVQLTELENEFSKIEGQKPQPTRYVKSQQEKQAKLAAAAEPEDDDDGDVEDDTAPPPIDAYDLSDPVEILSKLPKDFYDKLEAKKWQERKEALEALENLAKAPKLENGDYGDLVRALKKVVQKDSNVICVALAAKCFALLASGLKKKFQTYSGAVVPALLEKFKEKKTNVVSANREAIDAIYLTTNLEAILEDVLEGLNNKNPNVKAETALFLARALTKTQPTVLNKKLLKSLSSALEQNVNIADPIVRDASYEALGTLMKLVGEKAIGPFLVELEKDKLKMAKVKECCEKAVIVVKVAAAKKEKPAKENRKPEPPIEKPSTAPASSTKTFKRPGAAVKKKRPQSSALNTTITKSKGAKAVKKIPKATESVLNDDEVDEAIANIISSNIAADIVNSNWKTRLAAVEQLTSELQKHDSKDLPCQALVRFLSRKPGLKDTNFQVLKMKFDVLKYLAENGVFTTTSADCCLTDVADKLGDAKTGQSAGAAMTAIAERAGFPHVANFVADFAVGHKSPKVTSEALLWLSNAILDFGFGNLNAKVLIDYTKKALSSANPTVRQSTITLLGTMYMYIGPAFITCFDNEKAVLKEQIQAEFEKHLGEQAPTPTRGLIKSESVASLDNLDDNAEETEETASSTVPIRDLLPRVDISPQITESLIAELSDKNWKVRNEAMTKISTIIQEAKLIKSNVGNLPQALTARLGDSNTKIAQSAMNLCTALAKAMGPPIKQHVRTLLPGLLLGLGDNKAWMRTAALEAIDALAEQSGYKEIFTGEMIHDALKSGSPILRTELWSWLADNLPKIPVKGIAKEEILICIPFLFSNLEDRNADVRKNAQEAVFGFMLHTSYEAMHKETEKLKPGSKNVIIPLLEKVRPNLPTKPLGKTAPVESSSAKEPKSAGPARSIAKPKSAGAPKQSVAPARKKDEDVDTSPLLTVNNMKEQRMLDESRLKVLKWNFTTPREEFVELLKEQMINANVNKSLIANMFHSDFRYHLKAIESLTENLSENQQALISNLDLILKWLTLRFFDTNPSVLLKGLEYLNSVFVMLSAAKYRMPQAEASCFVPYLILKLGDPKDLVRNGVKSLLGQIVFLYAVPRVFTLVMEGIKSKNARQRAECLDVLATMIKRDGLCICTPSTGACAKEIAKQISDRDNAVRNAALNYIVQVYSFVGEEVYKMVGNISDKDMTMLEERIKRARHTFSPTLTKPESRLPTAPAKEVAHPNEQRPLKRDRSFDKNDPIIYESERDEDDEELSLPPVTLPPQMTTFTQPKEIEGPFKLDPVFMKELDNIKFEIPKLELQEFDLDFLKEEIKMPRRGELRTVTSSTDLQTPPRKESPTAHISKESPLSNKSISKSPIASKPVENVVSSTSIERPREFQLTNQMGSENPAEALDAVTQMIELLGSNRGIIMIEYQDEFFAAIVKQLYQLDGKDLDSSPLLTKLFRYLLSVIDQFYANKLLGRNISTKVLKEVVCTMTDLLVKGNIEKCADGEVFIKVINVSCCKVIERSDHTNIICALLQLSEDCLTFGTPQRQTDLVMKCLWRVIKLMPQWGHDVQYDRVLTQISNFFRAFPPTWWKAQKSDTLLRTVKTVVFTGLKIRGQAMLEDLEKVPDYRNSDLEAYVIRQLKNLKKETLNASSTQQPVKAETSPMRRNASLSKSNHNQLTEIFQKIGSKNNTKEGLNLLYDFTLEHPETDIGPFMKKCSSYFQDYVNNGLKDIRDSRESAKDTIANKVQASIVPASSVTSAEPEANLGAEYWKNRLQMWDKQPTV